MSQEHNDESYDRGALTLPHACAASGAAARSRGAPKGAREGEV